MHPPRRGGSQHISAHISAHQSAEPALPPLTLRLPAECGAAWAAPLEIGAPSGIEMPLIISKFIEVSLSGT